MLTRHCAASAKRPRDFGVGCAELLLAKESRPRFFDSCYAAARSKAIPWPPPMHMVASAWRPLIRFIS